MHAVWVLHCTSSKFLALNCTASKKIGKHRTSQELSIETRPTGPAATALIQYQEEWKIDQRAVLTLIFPHLTVLEVIFSLHKRVRKGRKLQDQCLNESDFLKAALF